MTEGDVMKEDHAHQREKRFRRLNDKKWCDDLYEQQ
jgi:hypothetical protein